MTMPRQPVMHPTLVSQPPWMPVGQQPLASAEQQQYATSVVRGQVLMSAVQMQTAGSLESGQVLASSVKHGSPAATAVADSVKKEVTSRLSSEMRIMGVPLLS